MSQTQNKCSRINFNGLDESFFQPPVCKYNEGRIKWAAKTRGNNSYERFLRLQTQLTRWERLPGGPCLRSGPRTSARRRTRTSSGTSSTSRSSAAAATTAGRSTCWCSSRRRSVTVSVATPSGGRGARESGRRGTGRGSCSCSGRGRRVRAGLSRRAAGTETLCRRTSRYGLTRNIR